MTTNKEFEEPQVKIKPMTSMELAALYGVNWRTFKKWLIPFQIDIGEKNGRFFSILQVQMIFEKLGTPG